MTTSDSNARASGEGALVKEKRRYRMLDDTLIAQIANYVKICGSIPTSCAAANVAWDTARYWIKQGKKGVEPYATFYATVKAAQAMREMGLHYTVQQHALTTKDAQGRPKLGDWRAALAELNRMEWSRRAARKDAPPGPPGDEGAILMYPVRVHESEGGVRLEPVQQPVRDAFTDTDGEDVTDADE